MDKINGCRAAAASEEDFRHVRHEHRGILLVLLIPAKIKGKRGRDQNRAVRCVVRVYKRFYTREQRIFQSVPIAQV